MNNVIFEGLRKNDFLFMLDNIITIDKYKSRFGDDYITVSFKTVDLEVAEELSKFLKMTCKYVFDVDINENINEDGYYEFFVEIKRDMNFVKNLFDLLYKISILCGDIKWRALFGGKVFSYVVTPENVEKYVDYTPKTKKLKFTKKVIENWIPEDKKDKFNLNTRIIEFSNGVYEIICFGNKREVKYMFSKLPTLVEMSDLKEQRIILTELDSDFSIMKYGDFYILEHPNSSDAMVIRKISS